MRLPALLLRHLLWPRGVDRSRLAARSPQRCCVSKAKRALGLAPLALVFLIAAGWNAADRFVPEATDPEYHVRLRTLRTAIAEHPDHRIGLVIGSSRMVWGYRPEILPEPAPGETYWLNGSQVGGGPILNRLMLHRLLRDGVRPDVIALEVMPAFFARENTRFVVGHFTAAEMRMMHGYGKFPGHYDANFLRHRFLRMADIGRMFDPFEGIVELLPRGGHPKTEEDVTDAERARRTAITWNVYKDDTVKMSVRPGTDRAFRDTLDEAAANGVRVILLRTPESPLFRSWYDPAGVARFDAYLAGISRDYGLAVIDASTWLEENDFYDAHHALRRGADKFTLRFAREIATVK